jgi:hypothetical protein
MAVPATVLADDGTAPVEFIAFTYESYDQPPTATITASSAAIAGEFVSWTMKYRPKDIFLAPTIWEGHARARVNAGAALPADAALKLTIPHARPLEVAIKPVGSTLPSSVAPPFVPPTLEEREPTTRPGAERLQGGG